MNDTDPKGRWVRVMVESNQIIGWQCECGWVSVPDIQKECLQCKRLVPRMPTIKIKDCMPLKEEG